MSDNFQAQGVLASAIRATITRADGSVEELGTIFGGTIMQRITAPIRIRFINLRHKIKQLIK